MGRCGINAVPREERENLILDEKGCCQKYVRDIANEFCLTQEEREKIIEQVSVECMDQTMTDNQIRTRVAYLISETNK